jgi:hypothetical protein
MHRRGGWTDPSWRVKRDISLSDRHLVEWVAQAKIGDQFPEPWRWASDPIESIIRTLVILEVIEKPAPDMDLAVVAQQAGVAARTWLEAHPPEPFTPPPPPAQWTPPTRPSGPSRPSGPTGPASGSGIK